MRLYPLVPVVLTVLACSSPGGMARQQSPTFSGWPGFYIECEGVVDPGKPASAQEFRYRKEMLEDAVEQLEAAGLGSLTQAEAQKVPGAPTLTLEAAATRSHPDDNVYAYSTTVSLYERVTLEREPGKGVIQLYRKEHPK